MHWSSIKNKICYYNPFLHTITENSLAKATWLNYSVLYIDFYFFHHVIISLINQLFLQVTCQFMLIFPLKLHLCFSLLWVLIPTPRSVNVSFEVLFLRAYILSGFSTMKSDTF
jgi:hypothetical protein